MKNKNFNSKSFSSNVNDSTESNNLKNTTNQFSKRIKHSFIALITITFLISATSCSRNVGSGCGAWPVVKSKTGHSYQNYGRYN
jgi:hypothetical protein